MGHTDKLQFGYVSVTCAPLPRDKRQSRHGPLCHNAAAFAVSLCFVSVEKFPTMSPADDNDIPLNTPSIVPDRDDVEQFQRQKSARQKPVAEPLADQGDEMYDEPAAAVGKTAVVLLALIAVAGVAWAGVLQWQLNRAQSDLSSWQMRVTDLENRLSATDENSTQSVATMQVRLKELDENLAKLRDDNLKRAKAALDQHTTQIATLDQTLKATQTAAAKVEQTVSDHQKALDANKAQIDKVASTAELSKRKVDEQQGTLEKLNQRINTNEEWVQSINNFRKQTNREIVDIKQQISGPIKESAPK